MTHMQKPRVSDLITEVESLETLGPFLVKIEPTLSSALEQIMKDFPDMHKSFGEMMKPEHDYRIPAPYMIWIAGAVSYMIARYALLKGEAIGTTEQPN